MGNPPRTVRGIWEIGSLAPVYRLRPPTALLAYYEGRDLRSGCPVGIVLMRPPWDRDASLRRELLYGIDRLRPLDHPSIARIHDTIDEDDLIGYVTDPIAGDSVYRLLLFSAALFTEAEVVRIITAIADGLRHAHSHDVLFANLKPTNVRLEPGGAVKIFALPKGPHQFRSFLDAGWYIGHAVYHSPEFLRNEPLDQSTDIYGLGITAYEMMVARLPYRASGNIGLDLDQVISGEWPAPADLVEGIDPTLNAVIVRCLKKDRAQRYRSADEVIQALRGVRGKARTLIGSERLQEIVTTAFPAPLAVLAKALAREDHLVAQRDKLLNQVNGLVSYLGFLAAHSLNAPLSGRLLRPSLGHWAAIVGEALRSESAGWPFAEFRGLIPNAAEFLDCLDQLVHQRNVVGHGPTPEEGAVLHDWVQKTSVLVRQLYRGLLFLARYALISVEDMDYQGGEFVLSVRRLEGAGSTAPPIPVRLAQPLSKGKVYFAADDFSRLACLEPFIMLARCPLCGQTELFFYASTHGRERRYVTPDRGHTWTCSV